MFTSDYQVIYLMSCLSGWAMHAKPMYVQRSYISSHLKQKGPKRSQGYWRGEKTFETPNFSEPFEIEISGHNS